MYHVPLESSHHVSIPGRISFRVSILYGRAIEVWFVFRDNFGRCLVSANVCLSLVGFDLALAEVHVSQSHHFRQHILLGRENRHSGNLSNALHSHIVINRRRKRAVHI